MSSSNIFGVIPAFRPDNKLIELVQQCLAMNFLRGIVIVDDGSGQQYHPIFAVLDKLDSVIVIHHQKNQGMGGAIKTGIAEVLHTTPDATGIVTFDADGQHRPEDVRRVVGSFAADPCKLVIGVRDFHSKAIAIPFRSRFGNRFSEIVFWLFTGSHLVDTQTGLRCYPRNIAEKCLEIASSRYEFQLEALLLGVVQVPIIQIPIHTIYEDNNRCSHFKPLRDSLRIYAVFLRFTLSSLICSLVDYIIFAIIFLISSHVLSALIAARVLSVTLNFLLNRSKVFHAEGQIGGQIVKFCLLAIALFFGSYWGITWTQKSLNWSPLLAKIFVELFLFLGSFIVQRSMIFSRKFIRCRACEPIH